MNIIAFKRHTGRKFARRPLYPNAATKEQIMGKVLDYALTVAASAGLVVTILFLILV